MSEILIPGLPSMTMMATACGSLVLIVGAVLLQRAARATMYEQRCDELRSRVSRGEAKWREAANVT